MTVEYLNSPLSSDYNRLILLFFVHNVNAGFIMGHPCGIRSCWVWKMRCSALVVCLPYCGLRNGQETEKRVKCSSLQALFPLKQFANQLRVEAKSWMKTPVWCFSWCWNSLCLEGALLTYKDVTMILIKNRTACASSNAACYTKHTSFLATLRDISIWCMESFFKLHQGSKGNK